MSSCVVVWLLAASTLTTAAHAADPAPIHITVIADLDDDIYDARAGRGGGGRYSVDRLLPREL